MIFIDSGFLFAFINRDEPNHDMAVKIMDNALKGDFGTLIISNYIIDEVLTLAQIRTKGCDTGKAIQSFITEKIGKKDKFFNIVINQPILNLTDEFFAKYCEKGLSYTDCSILACMKEFDIDYLASFDGGFNGLVTKVP